MVTDADERRRGRRPDGSEVPVGRRLVDRLTRQAWCYDVPVLAIGSGIADERSGASDALTLVYALDEMRETMACCRQVCGPRPSVVAKRLLRFARARPKSMPGSPCSTWENITVPRPLARGALVIDELQHDTTTTRRFTLVEDLQIAGLYDVLLSSSTTRSRPLAKTVRTSQPSSHDSSLR